VPRVRGRPFEQRDGISAVHDRTVQRVFLVLAAVEIAALLMLPAPANPDKPGIEGGIRTAAAQLRGSGPPVDLVQDYAGARALVSGDDPYEVLTRAYARVGLTWRAEHRSTHPPTAFILALPVAWLPWRIGAAVWAVLMLAAIAAAWWGLGVPWEIASALGPLTLLWPSAAWSIGQLTPLWLLGIALAWRWRDQPTRAGAAIGVAALTKLLPAVSLVPFLLRRRVQALAGFGLVVAIGVGVLFALRAGAVTRYAAVSADTARDQAGRGENAALLWAFEHQLGIGGFAVALALVGTVLATSLTRVASEWTFWAWSWAGVALLPIAWIYSLLPLLPVIVFCLRRGNVVAHVLVAFAIVVPMVIEPFGLPGAIQLAGATAAVGLALLTIAYAPAVTHRASERPR
jgi:hypothetical protein